MSDGVTILEQPDGGLPEGMVLPMRWKDTVLVRLQDLKVGGFIVIKLDDPGKHVSLATTVTAYGKKFEPRRRFSVLNQGDGKVMIIRRQ